MNLHFEYDHHFKMTCIINQLNAPKGDYEPSTIEELIIHPTNSSTFEQATKFTVCYRETTLHFDYLTDGFYNEPSVTECMYIDYIENVSLEYAQEFVKTSLEQGLYNALDKFNINYK